MFQCSNVHCNSKFYNLICRFETEIRNGEIKITAIDGLGGYWDWANTKAKGKNDSPISEYVPADDEDIVFFLRLEGF